jgi:hypothetical protein
MSIHSLASVPVTAQGASKFSLKNKPKEILIENWKPFEKKTLRGFLDLLLPSGLMLRGCTYHVKDGARWIGLPARQYRNSDGADTWTPVVEILNKAARQRFQAAACEARDKFLEGNS